MFVPVWALIALGLTVALMLWGLVSVVRAFVALGDCYRDLLHAAGNAFDDCSTSDQFVATLHKAMDHHASIMARAGSSLPSRR